MLKEHSSEHSQPTSAATSVGWHIRPIGILATMKSSTSWDAGPSSGVSVTVGATELTSTPVVASSLATDFVSAMTAPLLATGMRYFTIAVDDIAAAVADCEAAGTPIVWPLREIRPGVTIAMVEDPDGNWVEFIQMS